MKKLTRKQLNETVTITCYNKTEEMKRKDAIDFYLEGMMACEGSEAERYTNIYLQLLEGEIVCNDSRDY